MNEQVLRARRMLFGILSLTVAGMTAGIAWVAVTDPEVTWQPLFVAIALGVVAGAWLLRDPGERGRPDGGPSSRFPQALVIGSAVGALSLLSVLPVRWEIAAVTFIDTYLAVVLVALVRRHRRDVGVEAMSGS